MNFGDSVQIKGCTIKARHLETSSGNSAIDSLIGGGLPNTSVTIVDETSSRVYADTLVKYFIAEGLYNHHDILVVDPMGAPSTLWENIPSRAETSSASKSVNASTPDDMKIAWRYGATPQVKSSIGASNIYDLRKPMTSFDSFTSQRVCFPEPGRSASYEDLFLFMKNLINNETYSKKRGNKKNLLRIVVRQIGSPLWTDANNLSVFLARLQLLTRNSYVVVMATCCSSALPSSITKEMEITSDVFLRLVAMTEEEKKLIPSLDKFHGYFYIVRLPRLTSVSCHRPAAVDLVFELHRKSFDVKILHLPPALGDEAPPTKTPCSVDF